MPVLRFARDLGLLLAPPVGLALALESLLRRNLYRTGPYHRGLPEATDVPFEQAHLWTADGLELEGRLFHAGELPASVLLMDATTYNASDMWANQERALLDGPPAVRACTVAEGSRPLLGRPSLGHPARPHDPRCA